MVDSSKPSYHDKAPANFIMVANNINGIVSQGEHMSASKDALDSLSYQMCKAPGRHNREVPGWIIDELFDVARNKCNDEDSKQIIANLRKCVAQVEEDLY